MILIIYKYVMDLEEVKTEENKIEEEKTIKLESGDGICIEVSWQF